LSRTSDEDAKALLRGAFDELLAELQRARDAIDRPELMPPPASERNLAEGYRYLMGFVHSAIERACFDDVDFPVFRNALSVLNRATIDNADAIYFYAPIDGRARTRVRGRVRDHRHWRGEAPAERGEKAPHYVLFEATSGDMTGDSGDLRELQPGLKARTGSLDSTAIEVDRDGGFEILLAPERPGGYTGNFISTHKRLGRPLPDGSPDDRFAHHVSGRQLFYDWDREEAIHLEIEQIGREGEHPPPLDAATAAAALRRCGALVRGQMQFWNAFWTVLMGTYGERPGTLPGLGFPRNAFNRLNAASGATGGGMSTNLYAGGVFELEPDEALVVEMRAPIEPLYFGFQLANLWGESVDYANHLGSLNGWQCEPDADGATRLVVAHQDPGVPNWLDTTGLPEGFLTPRWAYATPPPESEWPEISATRMRFADLAEHLPKETRRVSARERRQTIALRRRHVQRRFRCS
jgi:hypothetical protein